MNQALLGIGNVIVSKTYDTCPQGAYLLVEGTQVNHIDTNCDKFWRSNCSLNNKRVRSNRQI